jgi:hypothetical protein
LQPAGETPAIVTAAGKVIEVGVMANRAHELIVRRGGPRLLASLDRLDHVEVVEINSGELVLFWDTTPSQTGRLSRALRPTSRSSTPASLSPGVGAARRSSRPRAPVGATRPVLRLSATGRWAVERRP